MGLLREIKGRFFILMSLRYPFASYFKSRNTCSTLAGCPSGQWEGTVNPPALPSKVQILHPPPLEWRGFSIKHWIYVAQSSH